jgi:hypothetical protein
VKYRSCGGNTPGTDSPRSATPCFAFGFAPASSQGKSIKWERRSRYLPRAFCFPSRHHGLLSMLGESHQSESLSRGSPLSVRSAKVYDGRFELCRVLYSRAILCLVHVVAVRDLERWRISDTRGSRCGESLGQYISSWELGDLCTGISGAGGLHSVSWGSPALGNSLDQGRHRPDISTRRATF